jgi:predicted ribosome quality control (RQC) complex YloA/Tae2 family protein
MILSCKTNNEEAGFRRFTMDGWRIFIGKNDEQNDELSTRFARPSDTWMHVASHPGSHLVIQQGDSAISPPKEVLSKAASLAAWFSKARHSPFVKVHVTDARNVRKLKGSPPGEVHIGKFKTLKVKPVSPQDLFPDTDSGD